MRYRCHLLLLAWPGLPHLWVRGSWAGLVLAIGFTVLACVLLAGTLVWTEWLSPTVQSTGIGLAATIWIGATVVAYRNGPMSDLNRPLDDRRESAVLARGRDPATTQGDLFPRAQLQYLQGDWLASEQTLRRLLARNRRDIEARLLLATLYRHMNRFEEASEQLARLERLEPAERWACEIVTERRFLGDIRGSEATADGFRGDVATIAFPAIGPAFGAGTLSDTETTGKTDAA